jgi:hypothetical protein
MAFNLGADAFPGINDVMRCGPGPTPSAQTFLKRAAEFFAQHDRQAFSIRARAHLDSDLVEACQARGMFLVGASPGMVIHAPVGDLQAPDTAKGIALRVRVRRRWAERSRS